MKQTEKPSVKTPEEFLALMKTGVPHRLAEEVATLTDSERKKLSRTAQDYCKAMRKNERQARATQFFVFPDNAGGMARLGLLAAAPKSASLFDMQLPFVGRNTGNMALDLDPQRPSDFEAAGIRILLDRRADWTQAWMERQIEGTTQWGSRMGSLKWVSIRQLLQSGLCHRPATADFAEYMSNILRLVDIRQEPDLIQDVWQQFQFETGFFHSWSDLLWPTESSLEVTKSYAGPDICYLLVQQGLIERGRLLDECLGALWREFDNHSRGHLIKLHDKLEPTDDEFLARQAEYIRLLQNPIPTNVTFAIKTLKARRKVKGFDTPAVIEALPVVFEIERKTQPKSALSLLKILAGKDQQRTKHAAAIAAQALNHPEIDIQESALKLLEGWASVFVPADALLAIRGQISPVMKARIDALLGDKVDVLDETDDVATTIDVGEPEKRVTAIAPDIREAWKLDESLAAFSASQMFPVASIDARPVNLDRLETIEPITNVLELIDGINAAMERIQSPMQVERILDGISRLGKDHYTDDFEERVSAIVSRFGEEDFYTMSELGFASVGHSLPALCRVVICWLQQGDGTVGSWLNRQLSPQAEAELSTNLMLEERANDLYQRLRKNLPALPLLSLPTHQYGWIDPQTFVERLISNLAIDEQPNRSDLRYALWRLAPMQESVRERVMEKAKDLPDRLKRLVHYAMGANERPVEEDRIRADEWLAAARARQPDGDLPELEILNIPDAAYGLRHGRIEVLVENSPSRHADRLDSYEAIADPMVKIEPPVTPRPGNSDLGPVVIAQTMSLRGRGMFLSFLPDWGEQWLASLWPANPEPFLATAVTRLLRRLDNASSSWDPVAGSLVPLLRPDRDWSRTAIFAIWLAAFSRDADARAVATDALIEGILDGRAHPEPLSEVLVRLCHVDFLKFGRLADTLKELYRVSNWAALVVGEVLNAVIGSWDTVPRDAHHLLGVQLEALMQVDGGLTIEARHSLEPIKGSSKTARLCKHLLGLPGPGESVAWQAALAEGLNIRINRAEGVC